MAVRDLLSVIPHTQRMYLTTNVHVSLYKLHSWLCLELDYKATLFNRHPSFAHCGQGILRSRTRHSCMAEKVPCDHRQCFVLHRGQVLVLSWTIPNVIVDRALVDYRPPCTSRSHRGHVTVRGLEILAHGNHSSSVSDVARRTNSLISSSIWSMALPFASEVRQNPRSR